MASDTRTSTPQPMATPTPLPPTPSPPPDTAGGRIIVTEVDARDVPPASDCRLWHNPLTIDDLWAGMAGEPFTAMCGKRCDPRGAGVRIGVTGIERCVVCADLVSNGQRIRL